MFGAEQKLILADGEVFIVVPLTAWATWFLAEKAFNFLRRKEEGHNVDDQLTAIGEVLSERGEGRGRVANDR